ncbi:MAG: hypothetical protein KF862_07670 [Chitinophagaceae bacterium]|nr:hypothetical protein [Chitinophagaceae bacterium]
MNLEYKSLLPANFDDNSRVWIYQSSRMFTLSEVLNAEHILNTFTAQWQAHGSPVKGFATVFFGQFIVLMADETQTGVSGCSTDSSVRVIKEIERQFNVPMFDRQTLAFVVKDKIQLLPLSQLNYAAQNGFITPGTLYFNNTVLTKQALETNWIIPVQDSWLFNKINFSAAPVSS